ncbi:hypothetical protein K0U91_07035 [Chryseobacterium chendengshani]|uniref:hypothetical protein n=1 Tax=Chryseobacterium sp. LJ668 TaxID=2864040 RepID=UPI001C68CB47|nr:hypothetical protein [Chryseobacterium sp. LJ668]MBW8522222.1 hypothetical protein [Chryseobacterium sp. LJ668]QYK17866.1 hypothetical protein K0U91_07035 [Chryseobacterium sp. LJ668]
MKKQFFLFVALLAFSFHYCNDNILFYKNDLKETKINTIIIQKKYNEKVYDLKVSIGENFLGKITSFSVEVLGNDNSLEKILLFNKENIKKNIITIISNKNSARGGSIGPVSTVGNCISNCTGTWHCYDQPTETGTALCALDCVLECSGA